ncbi:MAG: hypothetical protein AAGI53_17130 [Planctomycetota bacterium]
MSLLLQACRWLLCLPVGFVAGQLAAGIFFAFFGALFGWSSLLGGLVVLITAALQPAVGYIVGIRVAPIRNRISHRLFSTPCWLVWAFASWLLIKLLFGDLPESEMPVLVPALSGWWCSLLYCVGVLYGCSGVISIGRATAADRRPEPLPPTPFCWDAAS